MKLIDAENIDFVILEDSLHRIEHKKGDEIDCVIGAQEVKAIPLERVEQIKADIETDLSWVMYDAYGNETEVHKVLVDIFDKALKEQTT